MDLAWLNDVPKVELHLHLEGAIAPSLLGELVKKYGGRPTKLVAPIWRANPSYYDFGHFDKCWRWKNGFLREYEDFEQVAEAAARRLVVENVRYVEMFVCPADFAKRSLKVQELVAAVRRGLSRVTGVYVALVVDLARNQGAEQAERTVRELFEIRELGVIGVGMGGPELGVSLEPFAPVFGTARDLGFRTTVHAGESAGPESIWRALRLLGVERIGHGTHAADDGRLIAHLVEHRIPLEVCPGSNVATGTVTRLVDHPLRRFIDEGIPICINTDNPGMLGNSLHSEYCSLVRELGFSRAEITHLLTHAINASWMTQAAKAELAAETALCLSRHAWA